MVKVLFIAHDATRTGAPILLLNLLRWFAQSSDMQLEVILLKGGELTEKYRELGSVHMLTSDQRGKWARFASAALRRAAPEIVRRSQERKLRRIVHAFQPDVIFANTAVSLAYLGRFPFLKSYAIVCHLHELDVAIQEFAGKQAFQNAVPLTNRFICVARALKENIVTNYGVAEQSTVVIPEPIEIRTPSLTASMARQELGIGNDDFIVIGSGTTDWRKGPDLFIQTAGFANRHSPVYFIWIGEVNTIMALKFKHDIDRMGLKGKVIFAGKKKSPIDYFSVADVFFLSSREDPYPLVCLEAASQGKPIVCFGDAGGMPEFVRDDAGVVVPYMDLQGAADAIIRFKTHPELKKTMGEAAKTRAVAESAIDVVAKQLNEVITETADENRRLDAAKKDGRR